MKRKKCATWVRVLLMCLVLLVPLDLSFASKYLEFDSVTLYDDSTGRTEDYQPVRLMIKGQDVFSDTPGITVGGRTLVPIASIFNELNIPYEWVNDTREVVFTHGGKRVVMQINNAYATINGVRTYLPDGVAPRIMRYTDTQGDVIARTYVPVRFISEVLGFDVNWIDATRTVTVNRPAQRLTGVDLFWRTTPQRPYPEIRLKVSGEVNATSFVARGLDVGGQDQTIVDFQNTSFEIPEGGQMRGGVWTYQISDGIFGLDRIEVTQTSSNPATTRVTVFQNQRKGHDISYDATTGEMVIRLINTVNKVELRELFSTDTVVIETSENPAMNTTVEGNKILVDIIDSYLRLADGVPDFQMVNQGKIRSVEYRQLNRSIYGADAVRVSIELTEKVDYRDFHVDVQGTEVLVYVPEDSINNFGYVKQDQSSSVMTIALDVNEPSTVTFDQATQTLSVQVPQSATNLAAFDMLVDDNVVQRVVVTEVGSDYLVKATLSANTTYQRLNIQNTIGFQFVNRVIKESDFKEKIIVIDPGHGGRDPGAVGSLVMEKDVALKASLMLERELEKLGFKVYMTRSTDVYINLSDRASMAQSINADAFVSIHTNAHTGSSANGIEVLYGNTSMRSDKGLAEIMQREMVRAMGGRDRGTAHRPRLVVLRETTMPSVLVELGFISNPEEQKKLASDAYLQKSAEAMAKAIVEFFK